MQTSGLNFSFVPFSLGVMIQTSFPTRKVFFQTFCDFGAFTKHGGGGMEPLTQLSSTPLTSCPSGTG